VDLCFVFVVVVGGGRHIVVMNAVMLERSARTEMLKGDTAGLLKGGVPIERQNCGVE
jgi:hypothetical protein